jgi:hypothetical protein
MIDGGPGAEPRGHLDAWLVTDERAELISEIRRLAAARGLRPYAGDLRGDALQIEIMPVVHTSHATYGYLIRAHRARVVWAPEFWEFPRWARGADLMFAEAAGWQQPVRFAGGVGGHVPVLAVAREARRFRIKRLVFAHIGRPTLRALAIGLRPPFGEMASDRQTFVVRARRRTAALTTSKAARRARTRDG